MTFDLYSPAAAGTVCLPWPSIAFAGELLYPAYSNHERATITRSAKSETGVVICFREMRAILGHSPQAKVKLPSSRPSFPRLNGHLSVFTTRTTIRNLAKNGAA